ncbi:hypothetical protein [Legionella cherrii]|uniref:hypothetical protein n=1 Tax=Legionella cherrii TaxID=28084 RepID=UPI000A495F98|nr:hypothetical protein [Legionella cherrii]
MRFQSNKVAEHQEYFAQSKLTRFHVPTLLLLVSAFFIGWKLERKHWSGKIGQQLVDVGTFALLNSFKKVVLTLLK